MKQWLVPGFVAILVLAACGAANYDAEATEETILLEFNAEQDERAEAVACPVDVPAEPDAEFSCDVLTSAGERVVVDATMTSSDGDFEWEVSGDQVDTEAIAKAIENDLKADQVTADVECPGTVFASEGESFDCTASDDQGNQVPVVVTLDDSEQGFAYELLLD